MGSIGERTGVCINIDCGNSLNVCKSEQRQASFGAEGQISEKVLAASDV